MVQHTVCYECIIIKLTYTNFFTRWWRRRKQWKKEKHRKQTKRRRPQRQRCYGIKHVLNLLTCIGSIAYCLFSSHSLCGLSPATLLSFQHQCTNRLCFVCLYFSLCFSCIKIDDWPNFITKYCIIYAPKFITFDFIVIIILNKKKIHIDNALMRYTDE